MKRNLIARLAALSLSAVVLGSTAYTFAEKPAAPAAAAASAPNTLSDKEKADGWKLLFDGKNAEFRNYNKPEGINEKWKIEDGALTLTAKGGGDIITKDQYENFELVLEYKIAPAGNSGLMFGVIEQPGKPPYDSGPEVQIQDNAAGKDPQKAGWLYQLYKPENDPKTGKPIDATKPAGEWNEIRFKLVGGKGEVHMNGVKYVEFEVGSEDWNKRLAASKFAKWEKFAKAKKGHICLQDHGDVVSFRNIKIKAIEAK